MPANKLERATRYALLRKAGFSSADATKFKDLSKSKIEEIVKIRGKYNEELNKIWAIYQQLLEGALNG